MKPSCLLFAAAVTFLAQQRGPAPDPIVREGATVKIAEHTWAIPDNNVGGVPNVGIVVGSRATLVIDPGMGRRNGETVLKETAKVSKNAEIYIATTHFHPEHTTGYIAFPASAKYINAKVQEDEFAQSGEQMIQTFAGRSAFTADLLKDHARRLADMTFDKEYSLDLGGVHVTFVAVGPTHTKGDIGLFVQEDHVLFSGDVVMNESFLAANAGSSVKAWLASFETFDAMKPSTVVPSHGPIGPGSVIAVNRGVVEAIRSRALALKAQGKSAEEITTTVSAEIQGQHPTWPRANGIAALVRSAYEER